MAKVVKKGDPIKKQQPVKKEKGKSDKVRDTGVRARTVGDEGEIVWGIS